MLNLQLFRTTEFILLLQYANTGHRLASDNLKFFSLEMHEPKVLHMYDVLHSSLVFHYFTGDSPTSCCLYDFILKSKITQSYEEILSRFSENVDNLNDRKDCSILVMFWMLEGPLIKDQSQKVFIIIKESIMFVHNLLYILLCLSK